jgi:NADPH-dependent 2,4-dienoyl-CoA reductase/sulfur reductase-like enzyme
MPDALGFDVIVVGAGPAGIAAATAAVVSGARVAVIDENPLPGGQIYRAAQGELNHEVHAQVRELEIKGVLFVNSTSIVDAPSPGLLVGITGLNTRS